MLKLRRSFHARHRRGVGGLGWSQDDYKAMARTAAKLGMHPADLGLVMYSESGLNPAAKNPAGAYGLIQWTRATGMSEAELESLLSMSPAQQMPYVVRYFSGVAPGKTSWGDAGEIYSYVFLPGRAKDRGVDDSSVLTASPEAYYTQNKILDFNHDKEITVGDLRGHLRALSSKSGYRSWLKDFQATVPGVDAPRVEEGGGLGLTLLIGGGGAFAFAWWRYFGGRAVVNRHLP